jgi:hypothetical protein
VSVCADIDRKDCGRREVSGGHGVLVDDALLLSLLLGILPR